MDEGWIRDDLATDKKYSNGGDGPPVMRGNPCDSSIVKNMIKKIEIDKRSALRNVTKQASPMHEIILMKIYKRICVEGVDMKPSDIQIWAMMILSFVLCLRSNETLMIRFAHLEFDHTIYPGSLMIRLPWRKSDQTGSKDHFIDMFSFLMSTYRVN